jgi:hypothetical protein
MRTNSMGNVVPSDETPTVGGGNPGWEKPAKLMAQFLAVWSQAQEALKAGYTLRLIDRRLNMARGPISY